MTITVKCIEASIHDEIPIYTLQLRYPRFVHSELMTHRVFSRNASSSRAKPYNKWVNEIINDIALPEKFELNKPGMQGGEEITDKEDIIFEIMSLANDTISHTDRLAHLHKQYVNRYLEPFLHIDVIVTSTEWENFLKLRDSNAADPTIRQLAVRIKEALNTNKPTKLSEDQWHLPYVSLQERKQYNSKTLRNISAARCARVSYSNHDGSSVDIGKDLELAELLLSMGHMSPFEHQATPASVGWSYTHVDFEYGITHVDRHGWYWSNNFRAWIQNRALLEAEDDHNAVL